MERYMVDGQPYDVAPHRKDDFLKIHGDKAVKVVQEQKEKETVAEKPTTPQTVDAPAESNVTASKPVDFLSESKSYKSFNPLDVSGDLSLAVDPTGGVGASIQMSNIDKEITPEEFDRIQKTKKQKENKILAQEKADASADGPLLFLDFSQETFSLDKTKMPNTRPTIDGKNRSATTIPFVSDEFDGYWQRADRRFGAQREYINSLWQSSYQQDLETAEGDKNKLNEKVKDISINYLDLDVDKDIAELNQKIKTLADGPVKDELIKQRDAKFKSKGYVPLFNEDGSTTGFIQEEYEEQAQTDADDFQLDELEQSRLNLYYELVELGGLAAQFEGKRPVKDERISPYINRQALTIKGAKSAFETLGGAARNLAGAEDTYYDDIKLLEFIYDNNKLPANLTTLPGESQIAQRFNETLSKFKIANRAIEIKANLAPLEEESFTLEGLDNLSEGLFGQTAGFTEGNDETVQIFSDWYSEATGTTFDKNQVLRPGSSEVRTVMEGGRNVATDLTPLVLSIYATKKLPVGTTTKYIKAGRGMIEPTTKAVSLEKQMAVTKNAIQKYMLRGNKSKAYEKGVKIGLGAADEIVRLAGADVVGGQLFNAEGFVFNDQTGDVNLTFPGALGAGNVMAQSLIKKTMATKIPILTPIIANANRSKSLSTFMGANVSAGVGTATLVFAERVDEYYRELINDRKFFEAKQLEEKDFTHHLVENYVGMLMVGGPRTLGKFGKAMQRDVLRLSNKLPGTDKAGRLLGLKHGAEPEAIDNAVKSKINEIKSNKNLRKEQQEQQISDIRKAGNKLQYLHEYNTAVETAKSHGNYMQFLSNQSVLLNKIKQGVELTAKEKEQLANLKEYEFDYIKAELGVRKNSIEGQLFDLRKKNFENIVESLNAERIQGPQREKIIDLMDQYLKVKNKRDNLQGSVQKRPELEGVVKEKINKINEQLKEITDKIDVETKSFDAVFDRIIKGEIELARTAALEMGIKGFRVVNSDGIAAALYMGGKYSLESAAAESKKVSGFYDPVKDIIYLNKQRIKETRSLGDPLHELGHAILRKSLKGPDGKISNEGIKIIDQFRNSLTAQEQQIINERVKRNYNPDGTRNKNEYYEEYLMAWSDAVKNREITYNATTGQKISDVLYPVLSKAGFGTNFAKTDINGENIFLFMQALQRGSLKKGLRKDIIEFGKKAREGDVKGEMLQSKNITKEQAEKVAADLNKINEIKKAADAFAEKKGLNAFELLESDAIYQRASQRIKDNISETTGRLTTSLTKRLFDPIPEDFTKPLGDTKDLARQNFQESLRSELEQMVIREYKGKQELEKFIVNRGFLRAQSLAKRLGVIQEVVEGTGKEKQIADKPGMVKQGNELLLNMAEGAGPRVREATQKVYKEITESVEAQKRSGKPEAEIVPGSYKQVNPKYLSELVESFVVGKRVEVKGREVIGDKAMADRIVKQIETKQQLNSNEIAILKKSIGDNWLMFDAALPQGFTITGEATMGRIGGLKPYYNEMTQRATQETFGIAAAPSGRKPFVRIKGMNKETFMQPLEAITKASESGPLKSMLVEYVRAFENQAMRSKLDPLGEAFKHLADGRSPYLFSVNEKTGMSVADLMQQGVQIGAIKLQVRDLIESFGKANYEKVAREKHPTVVDLVETLMLNRNETLTVGGSYQKSIKADKFTPSEIKNQLTEGGIYRGKKLNDPTTRQKYVDMGFAIGKKMHPAIESAWIEFSLGLKDGYKGTIRVKDYEAQRAELRNRSFTPAELAKMEADMTKLLGEGAVENLVNATPMEMKGFVKQTLESIGRETSLQAKEQILANARARIENINKANHDMLKYMNDLYQKEYAKENIDNTFVLLNGALQTNIVSGKRAMSTFEYIYLREGRQIGLAKPNKFLPKTKKLPKRPNPKYNEQLQEYYKSWEQCAEYKERYNVRLKETKDKAEARELAISDLQWKNEHLGASATTNAESSSYIYSGGKSITLDNINNGHRTLWAPKYIADKVLDAKIKVGDKMIDNKVSLEGELRILKFGQGKLFGPDRKVVHFTGESASTYIANKNKVAEIINETLLAEQASVTKVAAPSKILSFSKDFRKIKENIKIYDKAMELGRMPNKQSRGGSFFDFDETLIDRGKNFIIATKGKETIKISSGEWPIKGPELQQQGYSFDFKDFVNVRGGVEGPLFKKFKERLNKFGPEHMYIVTARPAESAPAIYSWLKSKGVEIPLENITGLGNSTGEAKAMYMLKKFSEGYNDMYFVDDALPNVKAVRNVLNQLDIKSDVQQALRFSKTSDVNKKVNDILESSLGIESKKVFTKAEAAIRGKKANRRKFFVPDTAADLELLLEPMYGKGRQGIENKKWFEDNLIKPWERGINDFNNARQAITNDYMSLRKKNKDVVKLLDKPVEGSNFTTDMAMRIYIWNKAGYKVPDLAASTQNKLIRHIVNNPKLKAYADNVAKLTKLEGGLREPTAEWYGETIASEIQGLGEGIGRTKYIKDFIEAKNEIFTEANLNKMESKLGKNWRETIEDMFDRMETGRTRAENLSSSSRRLMNYLNGSTGTIMNFNTRSATLQLISTVNFINSSFNNPLMAAKAFANQPQYWKDFMTIMNSDMLKQRRQGLEINVSEAELAAAASNSKNPAKAVIAKILKAGYLPTKIADSFAISTGGATYYRNAINKYLKEGLSKAEAERRAFIDFQAIAERTQQSSRADLISKQQTTLAGRFILPFANTPMQMNRIMMKNVLDISKGRYKGFYGENSLTQKLSNIGYYGFIQSIIFAGLQSGAFALLTNSDDDELKAQSKLQMLNTTADSFLRGMGIQGAVVNGVRLGVQEFIKQEGKSYGADYSEVGERLLNISPTIGSKFTKLDAAGNTYKLNKKIIEREGLTLNGPLLEASTQVIESTANLPLNRYYKKGNNIQNALDQDYYNWQRILMAAGWSNWGLGPGKNEERVRIINEGKENEYTKYLTKEQLRREKIKEQIKKEKKETKEKSKTRCTFIKRDSSRCKNMVKKPKTRCHLHD